MRVAVYARVPATRQAQAQTIEQQLDRLREAVAGRGWELTEQHVYRDDGYSGASLGRPGLDRLRDHAALADLDLVLVTAPDRLARNYVHQVLLIDELARRGCRVEFLDRPMSSDPHDQLLLQIRGAVAEYERTLIAERMRRGRQAKLRAGTLLPWTRPPFGYRLDPERPRQASAVRTEPSEAVLVAQLFDWYLESGATVYRLARRLTDLGVPTPMGKLRWNVASVRGILRSPAYAGRALSNRTQVVPARNRKSAMLPVGPGQSHAPRPEEDWIAVPVPPVVSEEVFAQVQAKLDTNQQTALRNTRHEYLLRALVSCGKCGLSCVVRQTPASYRYYLCRGRTDGLRAAHGQRCTARYIPAGQLDELVWADLCALLTDPAQLTRALARAKGGAWLPQELHARQATIRQAVNQLERQQQRLLDAYLAEVIDLAELERKREDLDRRHAALTAQQRQLDAAAGQQLELRAVANGIEAFCQTIRTGLGTATFTQRRQLAELLIDRVIVTDDQAEIRYVLPTSPDGPHRPFCQLRKDHLDGPPPGVPLDRLLRGQARVEGEDAQVIGPGRAGLPDQHQAAGGGAEAAVPQRVHDRCLQDGGGAVAGHGHLLPGCAGGDLGGLAQPGTLDAGPAALAGARRLRPVQHGAGRQPGRPRCALDDQRPAVEGRIACPVDRAAGERGGQHLDHLGGQLDPGGGALAAPQPEQHRQRRRRRAERQLDDQGRDHPRVPEGDLLPALGGTVIGPPGLGDLAPPPLKEGAVHGHRDRRARRDQVRHDQPGHRQAQVIDVPGRAGEEPARPPELIRDPGRRRHRRHRAPPGQHHPARQRHEQRMRGPAPERRRQLAQQITPGRGHR
jgi:site-specific DNA recombinase